MGAPGRFGAVFFGSLRGYRRAWLRARPRRRADGLGGARAGGAGLRHDRRRAAGRRPLRRARRRWSCTRRSAARATSSSGRCRRPRRCRPASSATSPRGGRDAYVALTAGLALGRPGSSRVAAGLLRLGFLANVHLRAGAQGLHHRARADDHRRARCPSCSASRRATATSSRSSGTSSPTSATPSGRRSRSASRRWRSCSGCAGSRPWCPRSLVVVLLGDRRGRALRPRPHGVDDRRAHHSGLPPLGLPDVSARRLPGPGRPRRSASMLVGFAEGLGAAKTYAGQGRLRHRRQPRAARARRGQPRRGAGVGHGGQRQPVQDRGQRRRRARDRRCPGWSCAVLTVVTLLFLTGLFEQLPEATLAAVVIAAVIELVDIAALRRLYRVYRPARPRSTARPPARLHRRGRGHARRARLRHPARPVHRHRRLAGAAALPRLATARRRARPLPGADPVSGRPRPPPRRPRRRRASSVLRVESGLFFANADHVRDAVPAHAAPAPPPSCSTPRPSPFDRRDRGADARRARRRTSTATAACWCVARDIGQVRDVLQPRRRGPGSRSGVYPTVDAAVEAALDAMGRTGPRTEDQRADPGTGASPAHSAPDSDRDGMVQDG